MAQRISFSAFPSVFLSVLTYLYIRKAFQLPVTPQVEVVLFPSENSFMPKKSSKAGVFLQIRAGFSTKYASFFSKTYMTMVYTSNENQKRNSRESFLIFTGNISGKNDFENKVFIK